VTGVIRGGVGGRAGAMRMVARRDGRMVARLCAVVFALCLLHQLLMTTLGHALVMGPLHDGGMIAAHAQPAAMLDARDAGASAGHPMPAVPVPLLGDCPAQQAVFPLVLVLTLLFGLAVLAPLRPPRQRRALLQVFTI